MKTTIIYPEQIYGLLRDSKEGTRDVYGRIIYHDDKILITTDLETNSEKLMVDIDHSPGRTNYERYFSDIGSMDDIADAFAAMPCLESCDESCPFFNWPRNVGFPDSKDNDCEEFILWLESRATR